MPRHLMDDLDESERYERDGCFSDMERFERRREQEEEFEAFFAADMDDEDVSDLLDEFNDELPEGYTPDDEDEDDE